jgi:hypothetical protein
MFWTLELASYLEEAPWPATKDELIDYSIRSGAPIEVVENLQELDDEGEVYESIEDIWPDYPSQDDFMFNEDEYWPVLERVIDIIKKPSCTSWWFFALKSSSLIYSFMVASYICTITLTSSWI